MNKALKIIAGTTLLSCIMVTAFATSQADQNNIAAACQQPLKKYMEHQALSAADEQALALCANNASCTNPNLYSTVGNTCTKNLLTWQAQNEAATQQQKTAAGNTHNTLQSGAQSNTQTGAQSTTKTTAPAVSEFHSTDDAIQPSTHNANVTTPAASAPTQNTQQKPASTVEPQQDQKQEKQSINWF